MADKPTHSSNKRLSKADWSKLPTDLLQSILSKLSFIDIIRFRAVCSSWLKIAESYVLSALYTPLSGAPWLLLPPQVMEDNNSFRFFSLEDKKVYTLKHMPKQLCDGICIGSSHGWLVFLGKLLNLCLFNPFSRARIALPSFETFPHIISVNLYQKPEDEILYWIHGLDDYSGQQHFTRSFNSPKCLRNWFFAKAILSSDPSRSNNNVGMMVIYNLTDASQLLFCKPGDKEWTRLDTERTFYNDVICQNDHFYALRKEGTVEVWGFHGSFPIKTMKIEASWPRKFLPNRWHYSTSFRSYVVEKSGDIMLIVRCFANCYLSSKESYPGLYFWKTSDNGYNGNRTFKFHVYKLDLNQKKWVKVETLNDCALFLGRNHSIFISAQDKPECKENSIHFTDYHWDEIGGIGFRCDMGSFNFGDETIKPYDHQNDLLMIEPAPFWIVPNPW